MTSPERARAPARARSSAVTPAYPRRAPWLCPGIEGLGKGTGHVPVRTGHERRPACSSLLVIIAALVCAFSFGTNGDGILNQLIAQACRGSAG